MRLSIIIPCFNCVNTLQEAFASCYKQGLLESDFEIIMVDDGSTDGTAELMSALAKKHTNTHTLSHPQNRGGGAARNTGIKKAQGEVVYCLDSDNLFAPNSIVPMLEFMAAEKVDGVAFYDRRFFFGTNLNKYNSHLNNITERSIDLLDLFNTSNTLLDNFFYTKESYLRTLGYPEHHGFDTQCFEMRYLSAGNKVRVCPNSIFYHRQAMREKSYFERVHSSGLFSVNFSLIFEDIFHLFDQTIQDRIIAFPIFQSNTSYGKNILHTLKEISEKGLPLLIPNYTNYLCENGRDRWLEQNSESPYQLLCSTYSDLQKHQVDSALEKFNIFMKEKKIVTPYLEFLSLRILNSICGTPYNESTKKTLSDLKTLQIIPLHDRGGRFASLIRKHQSLYQGLKYLAKLFK